MVFIGLVKMSMIAKNRTHSTWTPLANEETNNKIFEERRVLVVKWFEKWTDDQRKKIMEDLIVKCKTKQKEFVRDYVKDNIPVLKRDFTRHLPRVISLYIFSFLDPRSLSRCAQVCWHWKYLTELDQLWMPKCLRLAWNLPFMPGQYEVGVWKRNYVENIKTLQIMNPKNRTKLNLDKLHIHSKKPPRSKSAKTTPWRGSDPVPKDTWRYNVLENDDVVENVNKLRKKNKYAQESLDIAKQARSKVKTGQNILNTNVRRSQSYTKLVSSSQDPGGTKWDGFQLKSGAPYVESSIEIQRPKPVYSPPLQRPARHQVSARTPRDPPTTDLFPNQPWRVQTATDSDDER